MFGGYDTAKYVDDLVALDIQPDEETGKVTSMSVAFTYLSISHPVSGVRILTPDNFIAPAVLDSGTTLTWLPASLYKQLASFVGAVPSEDGESAYVNCQEIINYDGSLNFGFGGSDGPKISVSFDQLAVPAYDRDGRQLQWKDGSSACVFGISQAAADGPILLGDTFLRSAYVVYDLDRQKIAIAPSNFKASGKSDIHEIDGKDGIMSAVASAATGATAKPTVTGTAATLPPAGFLDADPGTILSRTASPTSLFAFSMAPSSTSLPSPTLSGTGVLQGSGGVGATSAADAQRCGLVKPVRLALVVTLLALMLAAGC